MDKKTASTMLAIASMVAIAGGIVIGVLLAGWGILKGISPDDSEVAVGLTFVAAGLVLGGFMQLRQLAGID